MTFINRFLELTKRSRSPLIFRKWTAVGMVASAIGRGSHTIISEADGPIYPNFYIILVGPPGSGKSIGAINARRLLKRVQGVNTGPDKITPERLVARLEKMTQEEHQAILALLLDELSVLLQRKGELDIKPLLTGAYNCPDDFTYENKADGEQTFENCCINILATTQPTTIAEHFTMSDLGTGFASRLFFIHSTESSKTKYFASFPNQNEREKELVKTLTEINMFKGTITWTEEAQEFFIKLTDAGIPPTPTAPYLDHYCSRRDLHLTKLTMVMMKSRDPRALKIEREDIVAAMDTLLEAEVGMPLALSAIGGNQFRVAQTFLLTYVQKQIAAGRKANFPAAELNKLLTVNLTPRESKEMLESLVAQGICTHLNPESGALSTYSFKRDAIAAHFATLDQKEERVH